MEGGGNQDRVCAWIALRQAPGVGPLTCKRLVEHFGSPENVFCADESRLLQVEGMGAKSARAVLQGGNRQQAQQEIARCQKRGYEIIAADHARYPWRLARISDPPPYLYAFGRPLDPEPAIAVVGTRNPTRYGFSMARRLSADLADMGLTIVSGMARGIDTAAHQGALGAGGSTVAVLGSGLSVIYPPENRKLYFDISRQGTIVSERPVDDPPNSYNFPARNRIISGMCLGTVVVEAAKKSGSLITARLAAEQNREVFAVPGNINSYKSSGAHNLLKQGAKLVERAQDVIEEIAPLLLSVKNSEGANFRHPENQIQAPDLTAEQARVYHALDPYPAHIDELARELSMDAGALLSVLLNLELKGMVTQMPGKYYCIRGVET
ncbi:MAG: DNA-processing protein DprA [Desulfosalsimonas sp.]|uniref:DNA-processing protein DprA n=1 Tax=Desulfosalsimonas sp. TaxID=3073848 RepID=UPI003971093D